MSAHRFVEKGSARIELIAIKRKIEWPGDSSRSHCEWVGTIDILTPKKPFKKAQITKVTEVVKTVALPGATNVKM